VKTRRRKKTYHLLGKRRLSYKILLEREYAFSLGVTPVFRPGGKGQKEIRALAHELPRTSEAV